MGFARAQQLVVVEPYWLHAAEKAEHASALKMTAAEPTASTVAVRLDDPGNPRTETNPPGNTPVNAEFPRTARLLTPGDYSQVFKKSQRYTDRFFTVLVHRSQRSDARLGLAIAKKRAKRAVDRNRLKRITRESFRHVRQQLSGHELVVMNRDAATRAESSELRQSMDKILLKIINSAK